VKLLTAAIIKKLEKTPLYSRENLDFSPVLVKFFNPCGSGTWYVLEAEKQEDGDWLFFGLVEGLGGDSELGYFVLSELASVRLRFGLGIERDMHFDGYQVKKSTREVVPIEVRA
jgi:Protein of unknown function (DUF2958)